MTADQDLQGLVLWHRKTADIERDAFIAQFHRQAADAIERLSKEQSDSSDRVAGIHKLAKVLSLEDVMNGPVGESEVAMRLRLFEAIAALRVELATNKGQPKLVQAVCDAAAANLARAEAAEAKLTASRGTCSSCRFYFDVGGRHCQVMKAINGLHFEHARLANEDLLKWRGPSDTEMGCTLWEGR